MAKSGQLVGIGARSGHCDGQGGHALVIVQSSHSSPGFLHTLTSGPAPPPHPSPPPPPTTELVFPPRPFAPPPPTQPPIPHSSLPSLNQRAALCFQPPLLPYYTRGQSLFPVMVRHQRFLMAVSLLQYSSQGFPPFFAPLSTLRYVR